MLRMIRGARAEHVLSNSASEFAVYHISKPTETGFNATHTRQPHTMTFKFEYTNFCVNKLLSK